MTTYFDINEFFKLKKWKTGYVDWILLRKEIQEERLEYRNIKDAEHLKFFVNLGGNPWIERYEHPKDSSEAWNHIPKEYSTLGEYFLKGLTLNIENLEAFKILYGQGYQDKKEFKTYCHEFCKYYPFVKDWTNLEEKTGIRLQGLEPLIFKIYENESLERGHYDRLYETCVERYFFIEERQELIDDTLPVFWKKSQNRSMVEQPLDKDEKQSLLFLARIALGIENDWKPPINFKLFETTQHTYSGYPFFLHPYHNSQIGFLKLLKKIFNDNHEKKDLDYLEHYFPEKSTPEKIVQLLHTFTLYGIYEEPFCYRKSQHHYHDDLKQLTLDVSEKFNDFLKENHHLCLEEKWSHIAHLLSVTEDKKTHLNLLETLESKEVIEKLGMAMLFIKNIQNHVSNQKNTKPIFDEKTEPSTKPSLKN